jgi:3-phenylpropionate/cinnamic acid dioxygenase small subunit
MVGGTQLTPLANGRADERLTSRLHARQDIEQVLYRYCRGVDRADWDLMLSAFHPDATDNHGSVEGTAVDLVEWTRRRHEAVLQSMHSITNVGFLVEEDEFARVESYCNVHQTIERDGKPPAHISLGCRYIDDFTLRDEWRIAARQVRYDWVCRLAVERDFLPTSPELEPSPRDPSDPIYDGRPA